MPTPVSTIFSSYEFSAEELRYAAVFTTLQKQYLQTQMAQIATQLFNADCASKTEREDFEVQRSYLKGQISIISYLLETSKSYEEDDVAKEQAAVDSSAVVDFPGPNLYTHLRGSD